MTHICISDLTFIGSDNGLLPGRRQAIIWTNDGILLIITMRTNFSEILMESLKFSLKEMHLNVPSAKWWPFCLGLNVLNTEHQESFPSTEVSHWVWPLLSFLHFLTEGGHIPQTCSLWFIFCLSRCRTMIVFVKQSGPCWFWYEPTPIHVITTSPGLYSLSIKTSYYQI